MYAVACSASKINEYTQNVPLLRTNFWHFKVIKNKYINTKFTRLNYFGQIFYNIFALMKAIRYFTNERMNAIYKIFLYELIQKVNKYLEPEGAYSTKPLG